MWSVLTTSWMIVARRALADWLILSAALVTILLATVLLASGPIYADAVTLSGARQTLRDAEVTDANVEVSVRLTAGEDGEVRDRVDNLLGRTFAPTGGTQLRRGTSDSYALPEQPDGTVTNLTVFRFFDRIDEHATLVEGTWPQSGDEPYEVATSLEAARLLDLQLGDEFQVVNRRDEVVQPRVRIVGIYEIDNPSDPYWYGDELDINGIRVGGSFTTFGPLVAHPSDLVGPLSPSSAEVSWRVFPNIDNLEVGEIGELRRRVQSLDDLLNADRSAGRQFRVDTGLITMLREIERSLLVTRSGVLILTVQLAMLAGYALLLTSGLLVEQRGVEINLLRSRGAGDRQVLAMGLMEGALLVVPVALLAPWLASIVLRVFNHAGPIAGIGLTIDPVVTREAYLLSTLAALGSLVALVLPSYRYARSFGDARAARGRQESRGLLQRAGIDVALLVAAGIALWQLQRFQAPITETVEGRLGVDPLLVSAPAIGLLAGAVFALRAVPFVAWAAEVTSRRVSGVVVALSAWQVGRRPMRYARSALLLILALGIGLFAISYDASWQRSQEDQAAFLVGADLRVVPDQRIRSRIPEINLRDAYTQIDGYQDSMAVARTFSVLSRSAGNGRIVMLDAERAPETVAFRPDLSSEPFEVIMGRLLAARPVMPALPLAQQPERIAIDASLVVEPFPPDFDIPRQIDPRRLEFRLNASVVLVDGGGQLHRVDLGSVPEPGGETMLSASLVHDLGDGRVAHPTYPLSLVAIEFRGSAPQQIPREARLELGGVYLGVGSGSAWELVDAGFATEGWVSQAGEVPLAQDAATMGDPESLPDGGVGWSISSGSTTSRTAIPIVFSVQRAGAALPDEIPVIVTEAFLAENQVAVGDSFQLEGLPSEMDTVRIAGTVRHFPTVDPATGQAIVADFQTLVAVAYEPGQALLSSDERWMRIDTAQEEQISRILSDDPYASNRLFSRAEREATLVSDPVALGTIGALALGFVAAAIFATVGFIVSATVSARERLSEFALLRAVGLSSRQLAGWLSLENGLLVFVSLFVGTLLGLAMAALILPLVMVTQGAREVIPEVIVEIPVSTALFLEILLITMLVIAVAGMVAVLRRVGLGSLLRIGEN